MENISYNIYYRYNQLAFVIRKGLLFATLYSLGVFLLKIESLYGKFWYLFKIFKKLVCFLVKIIALFSLKQLILILPWLDLLFLCFSSDLACK